MSEKTVQERLRALEKTAEALEATDHARLLARMVALEHAFYALALYGIGNHAHLSGRSAVDTAKQIRNAVVSAVYDTAATPQRDLEIHHLGRMFDHVEKMAEHADLAPPGA